MNAQSSRLPGGGHVEDEASREAPFSSEDLEGHEESTEFAPLVSNDHDDDEGSIGPQHAGRDRDDRAVDGFSPFGIRPSPQIYRMLVFAALFGFLFGALFGTLVVGKQPSPNVPEAFSEDPSNLIDLADSATNAPSPSISEAVPGTEPDSTYASVTNSPSQAVVSEQTVAPVVDDLQSEKDIDQPSVDSKVIPVHDSKPLVTVMYNDSKAFYTAVAKISENMEVIDTQTQSTGICKEIRANKQYSQKTFLFNMTYPNCRKKYSSFGGTGNGLLELTGKRMATFAAGKSAFLWSCGDDAFEQRRSLVYPWLSSYSPMAGSEAPLEGMILPTAMSNSSRYCPFPSGTRRRLNPANSLPLKFMNPLMNLDLRRMAVAMVGVPHKNHPSAEFEKKILLPESQRPPFTPTPATGQIYQVPIHDYFENGPLYPDVELDDVAIHFRCGDVLNGAYGPFYYPKYDEYTKLISPETRSIGIVTQPFEVEEGSQVRGTDKISITGGRCKVLVLGLVDYMQARFPKAKISVRNGPGETITLAYARLIMANQAFGLIPSTFSTAPVTACFGTGYVTKPNGSGSFAGYWLKNSLTQDIYEDEPVQMDIINNMIYCQKLKGMWDKGNDKVVQWFKDPSIPPP